MTERFGKHKFNLVADLWILARAANSDAGIYGWGLKDLFSEEDLRSGFVYRRLARLAERGYLASQSNEEMLSNESSGPPRRMYLITELGMQALKEELEWQQSITDWVKNLAEQRKMPDQNPETIISTLDL